jgi:hypothetical protein
MSVEALFDAGIKALPETVAPSAKLATNTHVKSPLSR